MLGHWRVLIIVLIQASLLQNTTVTSMFVFLTAFSDLNENIKCRCFCRELFPFMWCAPFFLTSSVSGNYGFITFTGGWGTFYFSGHGALVPIWLQDDQR